MNYQWIPLGLAIISVIFLIAKGPAAVTAQAYVTQTHELVEIKTILQEQADDSRAHMAFEQDLLDDIDEMKDLVLDKK